MSVFKIGLIHEKGLFQGQKGQMCHHKYMLGM